MHINTVYCFLMWLFVRTCFKCVGLMSYIRCLLKYISNINNNYKLFVLDILWRLHWRPTQTYDDTRMYQLLPYQQICSINREKSTKEIMWLIIYNYLFIYIDQFKLYTVFIYLSITKMKQLIWIYIKTIIKYASYYIIWKIKHLCNAFKKM